MGGARRALGLVLAAVLAVGVVVAVVASRHGSGAGGGSTKNLTLVRGIVGSEKRPFFDDRAVAAAFAKAGYKVEVDYDGSRDIVQKVRQSQRKYDFVFPAGAPQGDRIAADTNGRSSVPFFSPMTIATFRPLADLLVHNGMATRIEGDYYRFDIAKYLEVLRRGVRWKDLRDNTVFPSSGSVLIASTDISKSNSAAMYMALMSYVANGNNVVDNKATADRIAQQLKPAFSKQGYTDSSTQEPFDDYLQRGMGARPMVMIYEAQFLFAAAAGTTSPDHEMVLMYPTPTLYSKHTLVGLNARGQAIGDLLTKNKSLQQLAVRYGFRTADRRYVSEFAKQNKIPEPPALVDVIDPPTYDLMEQMITTIAGLRNGQPS